MANVEKIISELRRRGLCPKCLQVPATEGAEAAPEPVPLDLVETCEHEPQDGLEALQALGIGICVKCNLAFGIA